MNKSIKKHGKASFVSSGLAWRQFNLELSRLKGKRFDLDFVINGDKTIGLTSFFGKEIFNEEWKNKICADLQIPRSILFGEKP